MNNLNDEQFDVSDDDIRLMDVGPDGKVILGGGDSALDWALTLKDIAASVTLMSEAIAPFTALLKQHVRFEEREFFIWLEAQYDEARLVDALTQEGGRNGDD